MEANKGTAEQQRAAAEIKELNPCPASDDEEEEDAEKERNEIAVKQYVFNRVYQTALRLSVETKELQRIPEEEELASPPSSPSGNKATQNKGGATKRVTVSKPGDGKRAT